MTGHPGADKRILDCEKLKIALVAPFIPNVKNQFRSMHMIFSRIYCNVMDLLICLAMVGLGEALHTFMGRLGSLQPFKKGMIGYH